MPKVFRRPPVRFVIRIVSCYIFGYVYSMFMGPPSSDLWLNPATLIICWCYAVYYLWKEEMRRLAQASRGRPK